MEELSALQQELMAVDDLDLRLLAFEEKQEVSEEEVADFEKQLHQFELNAFLTDEFDANNAILTFVSGAGGHDAQEWTSILLAMYEKYAARRAWKSELLHESFGEQGGTKEATLQISGKFAYGFLKRESGVHRLVRMSPFSAKQLRHTSFALVEVLPQLAQVGNVEELIDAKDIRVDLFRSSGPGGQNVNKRETAVRVTHLPTGLAASSQSERSQQQNRLKAFELLYAKLYQQMKQQQLETISALKEQVKIEWGHQIRSYVFDPYQMVKDHRTNVEVGNVQAVLDGDLDLFIEAELGKEL